jgi:hypothetical protein
MDSLLIYILKASAWLAVLYGFYWVFLRKETFFLLNRTYLIGTALLALLLPLIPITSPFGREKIIISPEYLSYAPERAAESLTPVDILGPIYIAVALLLLSRFFLRLGQLIALTRRYEAQNINGTRVVYMDDTCSTFSFFNYVFLNRSRAVEHDFNRILMHELVHIRQLHSLDIIFTELLSIALWFNPFVWPYKKSLRETHEYLADHAVIAQGCSLVGYQLLILEQHVGGKLFEFASSFRNSQIKRRLTMLSKKESKRFSRLKVFFVLPLAVLLFLAFADSSPVIVVDDTTGSGNAEMLVPLKAAEVVPPQENDEKIKNLELKLKELEKMKAEIREKTEKLIEEYKAKAGDNGNEAELEAMIKKAKVKHLKLSAEQGKINLVLLKERISSETDTEIKSKLKKKYQAIAAENEEMMKKLEQLKADKENQAKGKK